ncbi:amidohydrolase family protein [Salisediminibacterium beveridgei]|uniref:Amidohydrolase-related domain-containing protein n=1 Tax=Salisediminibacterium beveridgei TaxID=632773 RepID=A0A1D7QRI9_9BACI|nr:amidohydrolase family protein [Salisediminibacterium beveridgei]AOM81627.1 hypothetical protein BBEV_0232 [Salisediminibacterium beveridgei]
MSAFHAGKIAITEAVQLLSEEPEKQHGIYPQKGLLQPGTDADLTFIDPDKKEVFPRESLQNKSKVTAKTDFRMASLCGRWSGGRL